MTSRDCWKQQNQVCSCDARMQRGWHLLSSLPRYAIESCLLSSHVGNQPGMTMQDLSQICDRELRSIVPHGIVPHHNVFHRDSAMRPTSMYIDFDDHQCSERKALRAASCPCSVLTLPCLPMFSGEHGRGHMMCRCTPSCIEARGECSCT